MPVRQFRPTRSPDHATLVQQLSSEWRQPDPAATEPVIIEEFDNGGGLIHAYVVWSAWGHIDRAERGEIVMEAAEAKYGARSDGFSHNRHGPDTVRSRPYENQLAVNVVVRFIARRHRL